MLTKSTQIMLNRKEISKNLFKFFIRIDKRRRFLISIISLTLLIIFSTFFSFEEVIFFIVPIALFVYFFTYFSILEGITGGEWLMLFIPPLYFSIVFYLFYFFLPQRWLARAPFAIMYGISIYALLLSQNIFNVGVEKSLQLFRAAFSVNYLFLTLIMLIITNLIFSLHLYFILSGILIFVAVFPLALHFIWSVAPSEHVDRTIVKQALVVSTLLSQSVILFSLMPISPSVLALLETALFYSLCGLFQAHLMQRLFRERIREYIFVLGFVFVIVMLTVNW
ncbi:hypothetical protein A3D80_02160 [Candidatus Roizmanbacteria bacterium RIFCSPHIGHO2_02_FULL_40_13b]|uniref:Uncharacterized protein n=1 Tax=Candidatus Roizmanbacteria bacterium RIFCSPHIGHO2_01_FULL_39_24 TaxID=1802032 RepID=A0A1F7GGW3_9BACT|nr:MAG: hypothetical protein A2799_04675 [Candidatus Roizmanbacteria bacterium RIFCSPHIGHO2_01_FULL_39_24]OGK26638.1 MAG: hypothetical protein A3D80_02160 [Candidatus Roizmanbacteria bacterium RIFCSPHIGHO2_02_FULL_40_13b]